jgi:hypothetical protein
MDRNQNAPKITGTFADQDAAGRAYDDLVKKGYTEKEIHVLMSEDTRKHLRGADNLKLEHGNKALEGAGTGGAIGGAVGATILGIMAAASTVAIPGIGLVVAGPLAGALIGGGAGAAAGGLAGTFVGMGIPEDRAKDYEEDLKHGSIVMGVNPRNDDDARYFENQWRNSGQHVYRGD